MPSVPLSKISVNRQRWHVQFCSFFKLLFLQFAIFLLSLLDQVFFVWENVTFPFCYCSLFTHPNLFCYLMTDKKSVSKCTLRLIFYLSSTSSDSFNHQPAYICSRQEYLKKEQLTWGIKLTLRNNASHAWTGLRNTVRKARTIQVTC